MKHAVSRWRFCSVATAVIVLAAGTAAAQDSLVAARDLYAAAAYDDALTQLDRLNASGASAADSQVIDQYRAFCLLALGRTAEAERVIESVIAAQPLYLPSETEASPRVRSAFSAVRHRMLPVIIQQEYAQAKTAFDRGEFAGAAAGFSAVVQTLADPDVAATANQPPLSDLRTLAAGFRELSVKAIPPPPPPPPAPEPRPAALAPQIYSMASGDVVPPVTVRQELPSFPARSVPGGNGVLEIIIDEAGSVESAIMRTSVNPSYDRLALSAVKNWKYKPATVNGAPVKFRKFVNITLRQTS